MHSVRKKSQPINIQDDEQSYKLLNLTDSDDLDLHALQPWQPYHEPAPKPSTARGSATVAGPSTSKAQPHCNEGEHKVKRKVRLKRRQRNCLIRNGGAGGVNDGGGGGGGLAFNSSTTDQLFSNSGESCSDLEQQPLGRRIFSACCCCNSNSSPSTWSRDHHQPNSRHNNRRLKLRGRGHGSVAATFANSPLVISVLFVILALAVLGLTYFAINLQGKIAALSLTLEPVVAERKQLSDSNHDFHTKLASLSANQSHLANNLTDLSGKIEQLSSQLRQLNSSVGRLLTSMDAAPYMESLPKDVKDVQKDVAKFGSRMTEMEQQLSNVQSTVTDLKEVATHRSAESDKAPPKKMDRSLSPRDTKDTVDNRAFFESELKHQNKTIQSSVVKLDQNFLHFGTEMTKQLQQQQKQSSESWKLLSQMQEDIRNVTYKTMSNDVNIKKLRSELEELKQTIPGRN